MAGALLENDDPRAVSPEIGVELAELRAAVVELTATLRRIEERTVRVERAVVASPTARPSGSATRPGRPGQGRHRRHAPAGRHGHRTTSVRYAAASAVVLLPWVVCFACFAAAIGLIAVSTFA